ncbi:hypothetical protein STENM327S_06633 [Streptomyces tendae]
MEQPPSHPVPGTHAPGMRPACPGSYTLVRPGAAPTGDNHPSNAQPRPCGSRDGAGAGAGVRTVQPLVPNPIARYSFSSALLGSLAYTCDMYRCPCE